MRHTFAWALVGLALLAAPALAQPTPPDPAARPSWLAKDYRPPEGVDFRVVDMMSEGVRLHGELFAPSARKGDKLPTVIMAHGWGGTAAGFRRDAAEMAQAGLQVLTFDYRGWGESDGRLIVRDGQSVPIRGYIDPWEQVEDWFNAINWAAGEPSVDITRLGLRGSSYSGGHVLYVAARDDRVKAIVSQVGGIAAKPVAGAAAPPWWAQRHQAGIAMARGEAGYPAAGARTIGSLVGSPVGDKLVRWFPNEDARDVHAAALFILAQNEELVDNKTNGVLAYQRVRGPKKLVIIPGIKHYGIYNEARAQAVKLAIDWFNERLK